MPTEPDDDLVLTLRVNGDRKRLLIPANRTLLNLLRQDLGLTGSKHGCDVGDCGACTVLVNGAPRLSCITLAAEVQDAELLTVEGVAVGGVLHPVQAAFHEQVAAQCGYCTPGFVMALKALFDERPDPTDPELNEVLGANICRCTGYTKILAAARQARERMNGRST